MHIFETPATTSQYEKFLRSKSPNFIHSFITMLKALSVLLCLLIPVYAAPPNRTRIFMTTKEDDLPEISLGAVAVTDPDCVYRILRGGPKGATVNNASVGDQVYHEITCKSNTKAEDAYCLMVYNCTVSNEDKSISYFMINDHGCSLEPLLFEDVEYEADLKAGIRAQAIRFHNSPKVQLYCQTRLLPKGKSNCDTRRPKCIKNEYFLAPSLKVNAPPKFG